MGIKRDDLDGVTKVGFLKEADTKAWKGTTADERAGRDKSMMIGGALHDAAQIYAALVHAFPSTDSIILEGRAISAVINMREALVEKFGE